VAAEGQREQQQPQPSILHSPAHWEQNGFLWDILATKVGIAIEPILFKSRPENSGIYS
jgi:hypothetical protein